MLTRYQFAFTCAVLSISVQPALAGSVISPPVVNPANGHTYELLSNENWTSSETDAVSLGGHLATIRSAAEQNFVFSNFGSLGGSQRILWIGLNDVGHDGTFVWTSGEPLTYTDWDTNEPNNSGGTEDYVAMYYPNFRNPGSWNDWTDRTADPIGIKFYGVVEIAPEPASFAALIPAAGLLIKRRRRA